MQKLWVRITWDEESRPAIECPVGAFFGNEFGFSKLHRRFCKAPVRMEACIIIGRCRSGSPRKGGTGETAVESISVEGKGGLQVSGRSPGLSSR